MTNLAATLKLLQISDSNFPSGGFAFSQGLETLATEGRLHDAEEIKHYVRHQIVSRWLELERHFLCDAYDGCANYAELLRLDRLLHAQTVLQSAVETSTRLGHATLITHSRLGTPGTKEYLAKVMAKETYGHLLIVQGIVARGLGLSLLQAQISALYALLSGVTSAAVRLGALSAIGAQSILGDLLNDSADALERALSNTDAKPLPHAFAPFADIASMRHRDVSSRLFSS